MTKHSKLSCIIPATLRRLLTNNDGFVLPMVLLLLLVVLTLGVIWLESVRQSQTMAARYLAHETALVTAESAAEICRGKMTEDLNYTGTNGAVKTANGIYTIIVGAGTQTDDLGQTITKQVDITAKCGKATVHNRGTATFTDGRFVSLLMTSTENK